MWLWFKRFKRRKASKPEPEGVFVGSIVGARYKDPDRQADEAAAVDEFNRMMAPGLRQPAPASRSGFSTRPSRPGTGL
jgi:hypothetical protein